MTGTAHRTTAPWQSPEVEQREIDCLADELRGCVSAETVVRIREPLSAHTTLRVGGPADFYVEPASEEDLAVVLRFCAKHRMALLVVGRGSNLLVRDGGFRGVAVCLAHGCFARVEVHGELLLCGAGAGLRAVVNAARRHGLSGLEFLEGIPGTVGGALRMNAGAMGGQIFDVLESVRFMDLAGSVRELAGAGIEAGYRSCDFFRDNIALGAVLRGKRSTPQAVGQLMRQFADKRWRSQPAAPSAGCIFKNPPTIPAGKLIDELGLKGTRVGGAVVSEKHGNFIVTEPGATAADVLALIEVIRKRARAERGIDLETEVEIVGQEARTEGSKTDTGIASAECGNHE